MPSLNHIHSKLHRTFLNQIVGLYNLLAGVIATIGSVFNTPNVKIVIPIIIIGHVIIAAYVNTRMVFFIPH
ncbi:hypothetical protein COJ50_18625 [Bacillus cereus]|uniref:Uncharacterized protein n=1 Tax=Bacillus cereus TaxID=1396 RepID=A0A2B1KAL6_BACCE|nr:hypothetical protein COJ50_18625 [Bacillus cereus]